MIHCCLTSTFRICKSNTEVDQDEINQFVVQNLHQEVRVNISQLIKFLSNSPQVSEFLTLIKKNVPVKETLYLHEKVFRVEDPNFQIPRNLQSENLREKAFKKRGVLEPSVLTLGKANDSKLGFVNNFIHRMNLNDSLSEKVVNSQIKLKHVWGFDCERLAQTFEFHKSGELKTDDKFFLILSNIVIVYYYKLNKQRLYNEHSSNVCSIAVAEVKGIAASGDSGLNPQIRIWDIETLQTIHIIQAVKNLEVYVLKFISNDNFLIACSKRHDTPVLVYQYEDARQILNCYVPFFVKEIVKIIQLQGEFGFEDDRPIFNYWNLEQSFLLYSNFKIFFFAYHSESKQYQKIIFSLADYTEEYFTTDSSIITSLLAFYVNSEKANFPVYGPREDFELVLITGLSTNELIRWTGLKTPNNLNRIVLHVFKRPIQKVIFLKENLLLVLTDSLEIFDFGRKEVLEKIEINSLPMKMISMNIKDIVKGDEDNIFFCTWGGDLVKLSLKQKKTRHRNILTEKIVAHRFSEIINFKKKLNCLSLVETSQQRVLYVGSEDSNVYGFDLTQDKDLIDKWVKGDAISALDCFASEDGVIIVAAGTKKGRISIRYDWQLDPKCYECGKEILCLRFSTNGKHLVASSETHQIYVFLNDNDSYFEYEPKRMNFDQELPLTINFTYDSNVFIVGTGAKYYKLELPDAKTKDLLQENQTFGAPSIKLKREVHDKLQASEFYSIIMGNEVSFIVLGDENGILHVWTDFVNIKSNCGTMLQGHSGPIKDMILSSGRNSLFTLSENDYGVLQWSIEVETSAKDPLLELKPPPEENVINREIFAASSAKKSITMHRDSFSYFRGFTNSFIASFFRDKPYDESDVLRKLYPEVSLQLKNVYGFNSFDSRDTVVYFHRSSDIDRSKYRQSERRKISRVVSRFSYQSRDKVRTQLVGQMNSRFTKNDEIKHYKHKNSDQNDFEKECCIKSPQVNGRCNTPNSCERMIIFIVSRLSVVAAPSTFQEQMFYHEHIERISCITVHSNKELIATGEAAAQPLIHVWLAKTCFSVIRLSTLHRAGISCMRFTYKLSYLISVGVDRGSSLQVTDWINKEIVAFRNTGEDKIISLETNPNNPRKFATASFGKVDFWVLRGKSLLLNYSVTIAEGKKLLLATCLNYLVYDSSQGQQGDLLVGTSSGTVGVVRGNRFERTPIQLKTMINCLRIVEIHQKIIFFVAAEDPFIRAFDLSFKQIFEFEICKNFKNSCRRVQSLDVYLCEENINILIGVRNGDIVEIQLISDESGLTISREESVLMKNHSSGGLIEGVNETDFWNLKKLFIAVHPKHNVIVTVGEDFLMMFWDIIEHKPVLIKRLAYQPTCVRFSPNGNHLVVGSIFGGLMIFEPRISKGNSKLGSSYDIHLNDDHLYFKDKEIKTAVLNVEFSLKGDLMAVSYDNLNFNLEEENVKKDKEGSFVVVYISKDSTIKQYYTSSERGNLYEKYTEIRLPSRYDTHKTKTSVYGMAIYFMGFSDDDNYLMLYFQRIDNFQTRDNRDRDGIYIVWDLNSNTSVINRDLLKNVQFKSMNFPNSLFGFVQRETKLLPLEDQDFRLNEFGSDIEGRILNLSSIHNMGGNSFLGGDNGELYIAKNSIFYLDNNESPENIAENRFCQAKVFAGHCSFVNQIEINSFGNFLFTTSNNDECVLQWEIITANPFSELDHLTFESRKEDVFLYEVDSLEKFTILTEQVFKTRNDLIVDSIANVDLGPFPSLRLQLHRIIGRRAFARRGNMEITANKELIYTAGSYLVCTILHDSINDNRVFYPIIINEEDTESASQKPETEKKTRVQVFVLPEQEGSLLGPAEISCITICEQKKMLVVGTSQLVSRLLFWDMCSKSYLNGMSLGSCCVLLAIRLSSDNRYLVCHGLTKNHFSALYFVDVQQLIILSYIHFPYSLAFKIKDLGFLPQKNDMFVTVGIQHSSLWQLKGGILELRELSIEEPFNNNAPEKLWQREQEEEDDKVRVSFLSLLFLYKTIFITGSDSGTLYLWHQYQIAVKKICFENAPVTVLAKSSKHPAHFLAGGFHENLVYFKVVEQDSTLIIEKLFVLPINEKPLPMTSPDTQVQSLIFCEEDHVIVGTRNGDVFEIHFNLEPNQKSLEDIDNESETIKNSIPENLVRGQIVSAFDNQIPKVSAFNKDSSLLICITEKGLFSVYDLETLQTKKRIQFEEHTIHMEVLEFIVILVFEKEVFVLEINRNFELIKDFELQFRVGINKMRVNKNQTLMAIALQQSKDYDQIIEIYKIGELQFQKIHTIHTEEVDLLDFSEDNLIIMFKDMSGHKFCYDLLTNKKIETLGLENHSKIEWIRDGIRLSEKTKNFDKFYNDENEITNIIKVGHHSLIVADEIGTLRIFPYNSDILGYYRIYPQHLNYITNLNKSDDEKFLVTSSTLDRCVFVWKMIYHPNGEEIKKIAI